MSEMIKGAAPGPRRQKAAPRPRATGELKLQRKCACGRHTSDGSECADCARKRTTLQRWSQDRTSPSELLRNSERDTITASAAEAGPRDAVYLHLGQGTSRGVAADLEWIGNGLTGAVAGAWESSSTRGKTRLRDAYQVEHQLSESRSSQSRDTAAETSLADAAEPTSILPPARALYVTGQPGTAGSGGDQAPATSAPAAAFAAASPALTAGPPPATAHTSSRDERPDASPRDPETEGWDTEDGAAAIPLRPLLFDDGRVGNPGAGQMERGEFLTRLQAEVTRAAEEELAGTGRTTDGCPYLRYWFGFYRSRSSRQIERALHRYAPETRRAERATDYIPPVVERVRRAVATWARTGEITGIPTDLAVGAAATGLRKHGTRPPQRSSPILRKAREGRGFRPGDDPEAVQAELGEGRPLDTGIRSRMAEALGRELGPVHLHTDAAAGRLASSLDARAFTVGRHVAFAAGEYRPCTPAGDALIAHELAHVVQQSGGVARTSSADPAAYGALERDADRAAAGAVASLWGVARTTAGNAGPALRSGLRLSRCSPRCPTKIEVTQLHPVRLTADHVRANWRTGWGAVAEMKVSDAEGSNFDGISIHENLRPGTNTCGNTPNCTNTHGSGGAGGATFKVGSDMGPAASGAYASCGPPLLVNSLVFPAKRNTFYDCHLAGFGNSRLHQFGLASCTQSCTQFYDCHGTRIVDKTFTITRQFTRGVINGVDVTNIALTKQ